MKRRGFDVGLAAVEAALAVFAILFVQPHPYDMTAEWLRAAFPDSEPAVLVHTVLPIFLYPLFYLIWHIIARRLVPGRERIFLTAVYIFYASQLFIDGYVGLAVYRNIANPVTFIVSAVLPLVIALLAGKVHGADGYGRAYDAPSDGTSAQRETDGKEASDA